MKLSELDPQLRKAYRFIPTPPMRSVLGRKILRAAIARRTPPALPDGLTSRIIHPGNPAAALHLISPTAGGNGTALQFIHGGGMLTGSVAQDYPLAIRLAQRHGITVALTGYRLAPEFPFPAPLDDCTDAWTWLLGHAGELGVDPARIAIGGQSAGGGLAAMLAQRLHDAGGTQPVAQWLFCPMLDDRTAADRGLDGIGHRLWNNKCNHEGWKSLLGTEPGSPTVPEGAVPSRREDLSGLPPAWIGCGTAELFYTEDAAYARRLTEAGVDTTLDAVPDAPHAFESIARTSPLTHAYTARADAWLCTHLGLSTP